MSNKFCSRQVKLLNYLQGNKSLQLTPKEIAEAIGYNYTIIIRDVKQLYDLGCLYRYPAPKRGFKYSFQSFRPTNTVQPQATVLQQVPEYIELTPEGIEKLVRQWSEKPWDPKIFKSFRNLPLGLARLYELALETSYGAVIKPEDVNTVRQDIKNFHNDLMLCLRVVNGFLLCEKLWDPKTLGSYLLSNISPDDISDAVFKLKERN